MLEIYNYILGVFIAILFSLNNDHKSKIMIIRKFAVTVFLYACMMSLVRSSFSLNLFLKLGYFTVCFMLVKRQNFFQAYYDSLIIVLLYLLSYVFCVYVIGNADSYQINYFPAFDYIAIFAGLTGFYCLQDLQLLNIHVHGDLYDLIFIMLVSLILSVFGCILLYNSLIGKWNIYFFMTFSGFFIVAVGMIILFNYCFILKRNEKIRKSYYQMQQLDQVYYQELEKTNLELQKIRHDHKNHLINLKQMILCKKNEDAVAYIDKMMKSSSIKKINHYTFISYIDSYLNTVVQSHPSLTFQIYATDLSHLKNKGFDILIVLMNLVDNAIENSSENIISIDLVYDKCLIIKVSNYSQYDPESRKLLSRKGKDHGLGLKIIADIVDKYHGETYSTYQNFLYSKYIILKAGKADDE